MGPPVNLRPSAFVAMQWLALFFAAVLAPFVAVPTISGFLGSPGGGPPAWFVPAVACALSLALLLLGIVVHVGLARRITLDEEGIEVEAPAGTSRLQWDSVERVEESGPVLSGSEWKFLLREGGFRRVSTVGLSSVDRRLLRSRIEAALGDRLLRLHRSDPKR